MLTNFFTFSLRRPVQVLNISAGSWGPDNCAAYLNHYGDFNAKAAFLVVSSHDAYDNMNFQNIVGIDPGFPDKQYSTAIYELIDRYVLPKLSLKNNQSSLGINKNGSGFNSGFKDLTVYFKARNIPFFVYLHPEKNELIDAAYNKQGKDIESFCRQNNVPLVTLPLKLYSTEDYRDNIHMNERGQKKLFTLLKKKLEEIL